MISLLWLLWAFWFVLVTAVPLDKRIVSVCKHFSASELTFSRSFAPPILYPNADSLSACSSVLSPDRICSHMDQWPASRSRVEHIRTSQ
jgi:hypothetical protein